MPNETNSGILLYAQITRENYIHTVFFELVDKARELAKKLGGVEVNAVLFTAPNIIAGLKEAFCNMGVNKVFYFEDKCLENYSTEYYSKLFVDVVNQTCPEIVLIGATNEGRDFAPRISSMLHTGLTADCIDLDINEKGQLAATRPTFGGQLMATILCKTYPQMATVRPGVFKVRSVEERVETEFINCPVDLNGVENHVQIMNFKQTLENQINELDSADIIVAGGMGLKNSKGFELLKRFADKVGGTVAATRAAVEAGLAPQSVQIGQTGKTVSPKLYIACGISGAIQHTVGMENSEHIVAINNDENAQIFEIADTGIVGDVFEVLEGYLETL
ncbi:electron transfer flavoprotein subunit alpha/FixB family protein [bacterium]|nr:electron transfer flavoprotein subunit alpha/FixB family protein [bacterium]